MELRKIKLKEKRYNKRLIKNSVKNIIEKVNVSGEAKTFCKMLLNEKNVQSGTRIKEFLLKVYSINRMHRMFS